MTQRTIKGLAYTGWFGLPLGIILLSHSFKVICGVLWLFSFLILFIESSREMALLLTASLLAAYFCLFLWLLMIACASGSGCL